jgi:Pentapeptide repeats (8 copies)
MLRSIIRRVVAPLRRHVLLILAALVLLVIFVVLRTFPVWLLAALTMRQAYLHALLAGVLGLCLMVLMLWKVPKRQALGVQDIKDRLTVENAARQTLAQIIGGAVLIAGLFFTWANLKITQETATKNQEITREGQITDRFTKAIA